MLRGIHKRCFSALLSGGLNSVLFGTSVATNGALQQTTHVARNAICHQSSTFKPWIYPLIPSRSFCASSIPAISTSDTKLQEDEQASSVDIKRIATAGDILRQVAVRKLCDRLREESENRLTISVREALEMSKQIGASHTDLEGRELLSALQTSGIILRHEDKLYLKPDEIAEIILRALPDTEEEAEAKLTDIDCELKPMQEEFQKIERTARFRSSLIAYSGLALLCAQFALFVRLTYWELSWDVMEPVSYFTGQFAAILMYTYFLAFRQDFTYEQHFSRVHSEEKFKLIRATGFNYAKYDRLLADSSRWRRFARALTR